MPISDKQLAATTIHIPCKWVLPQLATGKLAVPLGDVLKLNDAGLHTVQCSFLVPVTQAGDQSELQFAVPRIAQVDADNTSSEARSKRLTMIALIMRRA